MPITNYGIGYDIHQIDKNSKNGLKLGGIKIPFSKLIGHSDADVVLHAICDSIFGALSMRDIGYHFPNTDKKWKNADSSKFIIYCRNKLKEKGYSVINLDINIIAEKPKINKYVSKMIKNISTLLQIKNSSVSIKATTNEKIGFIGNGEGIEIKLQSFLSIPSTSQKASLFTIVADIIRIFFPDLKRYSSVNGATSIGLNSNRLSPRTSVSTMFSIQLSLLYSLRNLETLHSCLSINSNLFAN